jgi:hypothetical protein
MGLSYTPPSRGGFCSAEERLRCLCVRPITALYSRLHGIQPMYGGMVSAFDDLIPLIQAGALRKGSLATTEV